MKKQLTNTLTKTLLATLRARFEQNPKRHKKLVWADIEKKLITQPQKLWSLQEMERTGGEPDVVGHDAKTGEYLFMDCSAESPKERRSLCFDEAALNARKEQKPAGSAEAMAAFMGVSIASEGEYRALQKLGTFDLKTSSWVATSAPIRTLGGALFCDRRYNHVFTYHNGAESYYASRGWRGVLRV